MLRLLPVLFSTSLLPLLPVPLLLPESAARPPAAAAPCADMCKPAGVCRASYMCTDGSKCTKAPERCAKRPDAAVEKVATRSTIGK